MVRPAFVIAAHKLPRQVVQLARTLTDATDWPVIVHVDSKHRRAFDGVARELERLPNVSVVALRSIHWGDMSLVEAILACAARLLDQHPDATHVKYLSGQDYPVRALADFTDLLDERKGHSFLETVAVPNPIWIAGGEASGGRDRLAIPRIRIAGRTVKLPFRRRLPSDVKLFGGSAICCFSRTHAKYVVENAARYRPLFRYALSPDEMFFQTVLGNSPYAAEVVDNCLTYTAWEHDAAHPKLLGQEDFDTVEQSDCYFARKFDTDHDASYVSHFPRSARRTG